MVARIDAAEALDFLCTHEEMSLNGCRRGEIPLALCVRGGDGVIVGVAALAPGGEELTIVHWAAEIESEWTLMDAVVEEASARRCTRVRGEFIENGGNEAMREFLAQFGFTMIGEQDNGTLWLLPVSAYEPMGTE